MKRTTELSMNGLPKGEVVFNVGSLMAHLQCLTDPRDPRGVRYALIDLLTLLILAKLGGEDGMKGMAEWVKLRGQELVRLLKLQRDSLPHQTTYERLLDKLDMVEFEEVVGDFFAVRTPTQPTVTLDGKALRGTIPEGETRGVHLLAAYVPEQGWS